MSESFGFYDPEQVQSQSNIEAFLDIARSAAVKDREKPENLHGTHEADAYKAHLFNERRQVEISINIPKTIYDPKSFTQNRGLIEAIDYKGKTQDPFFALVTYKVAANPLGELSIIKQLFISDHDKKITDLSHPGLMQNASLAEKFEFYRSSWLHRAETITQHLQTEHELGLSHVPQMELIDLAIILDEAKPFE